MDATQYYSPFHLILSFCNDNIEDIDLEKLKKQILLELQFEENQLLKINQKSYSKQQILTYFKTLENENLEFHNYCWKNKALLSFLEKNSIAKDNTDILIQNFNACLHKEILEVNFAYAFNLYSKNEISNLRFRNLAIIIRAIKFNDYQNEDLALKRISYFLNSFIRKSETFDLKQFKEADYRFLKVPSFILFVNMLPVSKEHLKEEVAVSIINLTYNMKHINVKFCAIVLQNALNLECSPAHKKLIKQNHNYYVQQHNLEESNNSGYYYFIALLVLLFAIILALS